MLTRPGEVVTREEFRQALWPPDVFVDFEQGISSAVMRLSDALRDSADNPIFVETIERQGYRWMGAIHPPTAPRAGPGTAAGESRHRTRITSASSSSAIECCPLAWTDLRPTL
jgi:DNA-binding winged helix-turn-helix (wHTH) protein